MIAKEWANECSRPTAEQPRLASALCRAGSSKPPALRSVTPPAAALAPAARGYAEVTGFDGSAGKLALLPGNDGKIAAVAFGSSFVVGVVSGVVPARRAAAPPEVVGKLRERGRGVRVVPDARPGFTRRPRSGTPCRR